MKIPNDAMSLIGAAVASISKDLAKAPTVSNIANVENVNVAPRPQLPRQVQRHLADVEHGDLSNPNSAFSAPTRRLDTTCDAAFLRCIMSGSCRNCFQTLQENDIDWANVVPDTPCQDILGFLVAGGHCTDVRSGGAEDQDVFCTAFDSCVVWDEDEEAAAAGAKKEGDPADSVSDAIDCANLTECTWPGMHEHFLGDGVCHDALPGCYNSKVCNYDGGDCCEDTCHYAGNEDDYGKCGSEGYACRDPSSIKCLPSLARMHKEFCASEEEMEEMDFDDDMFGPEESLPDCSSSDSVYRLIQFDSWGDGWDNTVLTLSENGAETKPVYKGGLQYGSQGTVHLCLTKKDPKCYHVTVENGVWGNEISWELRPLAGGAPVLAAGGSPSDCTVPLGGAKDDCPKTCDAARPDTKISDPNYKSYKDMEACIEQKCLIQVGNCARDEGCAECMQESTPDYCYANENFSVLIDCSMCSCVEERPAYCDAKKTSANSISGSSATAHEGIVKPGASTAGNSMGGAATCGPEQTLKGTSMLVKFSDCAKMDEMMAMVTEFDNDNFGMLDVFESCAHTYDEEPLHGGKSALDCMKILHNLIIDGEDETSSGSPAKNAKGEPLPAAVGKAISTLAHHLYHDAESFCECAANTNRDTPTCSSFINFKTLLFESVDACKSLDAIDCAAWEEFYSPCKKNLIEMYDAVDFENQKQCEYVENMCGGAGPFPAFRRLDCGGEIAKPAWDFHTMYERGCLKSSSSSSGTAPTPGAAPANKGAEPKTSPSTPAASKKQKSSPSTPADPKKQYKPYNANGASDSKKEYHSTYTPAGDSETESEDYSEKKKKKHHVLHAFIVIAFLSGVYVWNKRRRQHFDYARFRQMREARNYAGGLGSGLSGGGGGVWTAVSMTDSCSFEPPTLPPTP